MLGPSAMLNNSLPVYAAPTDRIPIALKILIVAVASTVAAVFGSLLAGSVGAVICGLLGGAAAGTIASCLTTRQQAAPMEVVEEAEIEIDTALMNKLATLYPLLRNHQNHEKIVWEHENFLIFRHADAPNLIFKLEREDEPGQLRKQFLQNRKEREICRSHRLNLLVIPESKLFSIEDAAGNAHPLLVRRSLNIDQSVSPSTLYHNYTADFKQTIHQLATLIITAKLRGFDKSTVSIFDHAPGFQGNRRIALLHWTSGGGDRATGIYDLMRSLVDQDLIKEVFKAAVRRGFLSQEAADLHQSERIDEVDFKRRLSQFHASRGILENPVKPIAVNINELGLDLELEEPAGIDHNGVAFPAVRMGGVTEAVIEEINRLIRIQGDPESSTQVTRWFYLDREENPQLHQYRNCGARLDPAGSVENLWIRKIIGALIARGHLFDVVYNEAGYSVWA